MTKYQLNKGASQDVIKRQDQFVLCRRKLFTLELDKTIYDNNFSLYDLDKGYEYLIDSEDVYDTEEELEEYGFGGILRESLMKLEDIDEILISAWKVYYHKRRGIASKVD